MMTERLEQIMYQAVDLALEKEDNESYMGWVIDEAKKEGASTLDIIGLEDFYSIFRQPGINDLAGYLSTTDEDTAILRFIQIQEFLYKQGLPKSDEALKIAQMWHIRQKTLKFYERFAVEVMQGNKTNKGNVAVEFENFKAYVSGNMTYRGYRLIMDAGLMVKLLDDPLNVSDREIRETFNYVTH
jgi:hypothetical protein